MKTGSVRTTYLVSMSDDYHPFAQMIRDGRKARGWTQEDLIEASGVSPATVARYEGYKPGSRPHPEPENVRKIFNALGVDPREAAVVLGYLTRDEIGLGPTPPRVFDASVEEVISILQDPDVSDTEKVEWVEYLRFRTGRPAGRRRRTG